MGNRNELAGLVATLDEVRRGVAGIAAARNRLRLTRHGLEARSARLEEQARGVLRKRDEATARSLLTRRAELLGEIEALTRREDQLAADGDRLTLSVKQLEAQVVTSGAADPGRRPSN